MSRTKRQWQWRESWLSKLVRLEQLGYFLSLLPLVCFFNQWLSSKASGVGNFSSEESCFNYQVRLPCTLKISNFVKKTVVVTYLRFEQTVLWCMVLVLVWFKATSKNFQMSTLFLGHSVMFSMSVKLYIYTVSCFYSDFHSMFPRNVTLIIDTLVLPFVWAS